MDKNLYKIIISGYLHDMGKLLWRGGMERKGTKKYEVAHAQQVFDFFQNEDYCDFWKEIGLIASLHHARDFKKFNNRKDENQKKLAWTVYMADNISSKERVDEENLEEEKKYEHIKNFGLRTVFENIFNNSLSSKFGYIPTKLSGDNIKFELTDKGAYLEDESDFTKNLIKGIGDTRISNGFKNLAEGFIKDLKLLTTAYNKNDLSLDELKTLVYNIDVLTQNYFSLVPSDAYKSIGDISLYDHTKTTVAIATAIYKSGFHDNEYKYDAESSDTDKVCKETIGLIAGDFPSIQKYIFGNIHSNKSIAKRLRAKSIKVQLLNESVLEYLLTELGLTRASVLMNAGGKFVILTDAESTKKTNEIGHKINHFLLEEYEGNIKFCINYKTYLFEDIFEIGNKEIKIQDKFADLFDDLSTKKYQIYDKDNLLNLFNEKSVSGKCICKSCGLYYTEKDNIEENNDENICKFCDNDIKLGENIVKGQEGIFIKYNENGNFIFDRSFDDGDIYIKFNNRDIDDCQRNTISKSINLYVPSKSDGSTKTFEDIIGDEKYLCMLKGDIDNMGLILKYGFDYENGNKSIYSVSRLVQFSRMLELFFGKYLGETLKQNFENVYTVFSGGDDFVFIIPFKDRLKFIKELYNLFGKFTANNQKIHFSVGLSLFKDKTPFNYVDEYAEELLKSAKLSSKHKISDGNTSKLDTRGICLYQSEFATTETNDNIDLDKNLELNWNIGDNNSTMLYTLYLNLVQMSKILEEGNVNWSKYLVLGAKITYMISKNLKKEQKNEILSTLRPIIATIDDIDKQKEKINNLILKIVNKIYECRQ